MQPWQVSRACSGIALSQLKALEFDSSDPVVHLHRSGMQVDFEMPLISIQGRQVSPRVAPCVKTMISSQSVYVTKPLADSPFSVDDIFRRYSHLAAGYTCISPSNNWYKTFHNRQKLQAMASVVVPCPTNKCTEFEMVSGSRQTPITASSSKTQSRCWRWPIVAE